LGYTPIAGGSQFKFIYAKSDLPSASGGVITLAANVTYYITTTIDLTGDRLVCSANTTILGASSENCILKSTGLSSSTALITSVYSLPLRNITITHGTALNLDGDASTTALDWFGVNFTDCAIVGTIKNYNNFVMTDSAFLNSQGLTFDGTFGTIAFSNTLFDNRTSGTSIILPAYQVYCSFNISLIVSNIFFSNSAFSFTKSKTPSTLTPLNFPVFIKLFHVSLFAM